MKKMETMTWGDRVGSQGDNVDGNLEDGVGPTYSA